MKKYLLLTFSLLFLYAGHLQAQGKQVTGLVTDADGTTLPGVNVIIKGTTKGSTTDADGKYAIAAPDSASLVFTYVGYLTQTVAIGSKSVINVTLAADVVSLGEVQVTALGIERSTKSLTYATQPISGAEINTAKEANFVNTLAGKSAGVVITRGAGGVGSSSKIVLRGNKSILGNNQPLYVIDGVPMNNAAGTQAVDLFGGMDAGDAISNLNPEDIESINILKGASAAALYGSAAANGVILVTTKKGKDGISRIDFSSSTTFETPLVLPKIQTTYGQAQPGVSPESWGPKVAGGSNAHIKDFFETGATYINSLSVTSGNKLGQFYISYANTTAKGIMPENKLIKHNINLRGSTKLLKDKLSLDASVNYIKQDIQNRQSSGLYYNSLVGLYLFPTGDNFANYSGSNFEQYNQTRNFNVQNWPYSTNEGYSSQNPYWVAKRNPNSLLRDRTITSMVAKYEFTDWLSIQGRATYDRTQDNYEQHLYASTDIVLASANGEYTKRTSNFNQLYSDVLLSLNRDLAQGITLATTLGFSNIENHTADTRISSATDNLGNILTKGLYYANWFSVDNMQPGFTHNETFRPTLTQAVFGTASLGYKDLLFLDVTARNEWSSTVSSSFFYPSVGLSYVLSETIGANNILSFAKLRGSYSEVGNALPYGAAIANPPVSVSPTGSIILPSIKPLGELKPERTRSFELGADLKFLENRVDFNFTYYNALSYDQVFPIPAPTGAGVAEYWINGGEIRNKGFEIVLGYNASFGDFKWQPALNMSRNINEIIELDDRLKSDFVVLTPITTNKIYQLLIKEGGSYGDIYGRILQKDAQGNVQVDDQGNPVIAANNPETGNEYFNLGNVNPEFLAGLNNRFSYKNVNFSFLIDGRFGGKVTSLTEGILDGKGLSERSGSARDAGKVMAGNVEFDPGKYYRAIGGSNPVAGEYVYSATNIRLREVALGYTFPKIGKVVQNLNLSFVGRNLFFLKNDAPFDPESSISAGNGLQGLDAFNLPTTRSYGFSIKAAF
jgi:TonB-linked SusC/RagA family outer membrane protein